MAHFIFGILNIKKMVRRYFDYTFDLKFGSSLRDSAKACFCLIISASLELSIVEHDWTTVV